MSAKANATLGFYWVYRKYDGYSGWEILEYTDLLGTGDYEWWAFGRDCPLDADDLREYVMTHAIGPLTKPAATPVESPQEPNGGRPSLGW